MKRSDPASVDREVARVRRVYGHYDSDAGEQKKRDPTNLGNLAARRQRSRLMEAILARHGATAQRVARVLDVGCGAGDLLTWFAERGYADNQLFGVDVLEDRIASARRQLPDARLLLADCRHLPFADHHFDLVCLIVVLSSVLGAQNREQLAHELVRVLRPGGFVLYYDLRYPSVANPHLRAASRAELLSLFAPLNADLQPVTLLPPLARRLGPLTPALYALLHTIPPLRSHFIGVLGEQVDSC
jgi:ubiquinone/menaquinone biosynthesis C-methylase UbiE